MEGRLSPAELVELEALIAERDRRANERAVLQARHCYVPHGLHPKQLAFLALTCSEALYGGAAGGGKTDALLAAALQYVDVRGYSALLLRRTFPALCLPNAVMDRARQWLSPTLAAWSAERKQWAFPSGATLQFGFCDSPSDLERYQSAEFQYVGIDELTEWPEAWYRFLFSRLRRPASLDVPLRFRSATNPGGIGQEWVRKQFAIPEDQIVEAPIGLGTDTVFLPARAEDNPSLDLASYEQSLRRLGPAKFAQLRWGRWIRDAEGLVYGSFTRRKNLIPSLPSADPQRPWRRHLALDFGVVDRNAIALIAWREHDPRTYVERCFAVRGGPSAFADVVKPIYDDRSLAVTKIVGDVGGLGKAYEEEFMKRFRLPMRAAKKNDKLGNISLINAAMADAMLVIVEPACGDLVAELEALPWAEGREGKRESDGFDNHCCDTMLYGWRESPSYGQTPVDDRPTPEADRIRAETRAAWARDERMLQVERERREDLTGMGTSFDPFAHEGWG